MKVRKIVPYIYSIIPVIRLLTFNIGFTDEISRKNPGAFGLIFYSTIHACMYETCWADFPCCSSLFLLFVSAATESQLEDARLAIERFIMSRIYTHAVYPNSDGDIMRDQ